MKNNILKIFGVLIIAILIIQNTVVYATSKSDLQNDKEEVDDKIKDKENEIDNLEAQKSEALKTVQNLIYQISDSESKVKELETKINDLQAQIKIKEKDIKEKEVEYNQQQEMLDKRMIAIYEKGETTYLDVLLTATSITDFLDKYYSAKELVEYDQELIETTKEQKEKIENEKAELEANKNELNTSLAKQQEESTNLNKLKTEKQKYVNQLSEQEKQAQADLEQFEKDKKEIEAELARIAAEEAANSGNNNIIGKPSQSGYICPIPGKSKANITTGYGSYSWGGNHTGVDWAVSKGTPILSVKDGTVITSKPLKNSDGSYRSYGEYIIISHGDGTMTLYAHGLPGSRLVKEGEKVKQGQQIMSVGTTGNSTGYHLHFEVRVNGKCVNPTPYLP